MNDKEAMEKDWIKVRNILNALLEILNKNSTLSQALIESGINIKDFPGSITYLDTYLEIPADVRSKLDMGEDSIPKAVPYKDFEKTMVSDWQFRRSATVEVYNFLKKEHPVFLKESVFFEHVEDLAYIFEDYASIEEYNDAQHTDYFDPSDLSHDRLVLRTDADEGFVVVNTSRLESLVQEV